MEIKNKIRKNVPKANLIVRKDYRQIGIPDKVFYQNMKAYRGHRTDTNLLNIKFKTIICGILDQMCLTK